MASLNDKVQQIKGELEETEGEVKQGSDDLGTKIEGYLDEAKGKLRKATTDDNSDDDED